MDLLTDIENVLAARTTDGLWRQYKDRLAGLGFPYISYYSIRIIETGGDRRVDDWLFLTSCAPRLLHEVLAQDAFASVPMYRWLAANRGSESWDWMQKLRQAGRLSDTEERMLDLFARHGHVSGYAVSLSDSVQQVRAGVILSGVLGMDQRGLDALWRQHGALVEALTGLVHLRLATLPYDPPKEVLTLRQREVLEQIAVGRTTQEIAELLGVSRATVEKHLRLARQALGARTTPQAILQASNRRQIFLDPGEGCSVEAGDSPAPDHAWRFQSFAAPAPTAPTAPGAAPGSPASQSSRAGTEAPSAERILRRRGV